MSHPRGSIPARQDQRNINRTKSAKPVGKLAGNRQGITAIRKHVVGKPAEWAMEDGVHAQSLGRRELFRPNYSQIPLIWADNSAQNQLSVLSRYASCFMFDGGNCSKAWIDKTLTGLTWSDF